MGRYDYQCSECDHVFEARHSAKVTLTECPACEKSSLNKIMNMPKINKNIYKKTSAGSLVRKTIEEMKKDIAEEKANLKNRETKK